MHTDHVRPSVWSRMVAPSQVLAYVLIAAYYAVQLASGF